MQAIPKTHTNIFHFSEFFYVRNHLPVPEIDADSYELEIEVAGTDIVKTMTLKDIQSLPKYDVTAAIMCGGNRRSEMTKTKPVKGLSWGPAAVGNARWSGPRLCDILKEMGIQSDEKRHVHVSILNNCILFPTYVGECIENVIGISSSLKVLTWIQLQRIMLPPFH